MTPEQRKAAAAKGRATRKANLARAKAIRNFKAATARKLEKAKAIADDVRGEPNTRAIAAVKAKELSELRPPGSPPPLPKTPVELEVQRAKVAAERRVKRATHVHGC